MGQFLTGMGFGSTCCAKLAGIKTATANKATTYHSTERGLK
jgi:hypothetical protein